MSSFADQARTRVEELVAFFGINARVEVTESEEGITLAIPGSPLTPRLIGHHGETLRAIEYLVQQMSKQVDESGPRLSVDVAGYREARKGTLEELARSTAERVIVTGTEEELRPMNPAERRIVHMALRDDKRIQTESRGSDRNRRIVIMVASGE